MNVLQDSKFAHEARLNRTADARVFSDVAASSVVVNRTHRVVRQRAQVMKARRSYLRSLMVPLTICSALLILTIAAVWSGMYEYRNAADAIQDVSSSIASASENEFLVMLFWFVPVTLTVMGAVWFTRARTGSANGISR
jgi:membrane-associated HD superfamily phosphohydrolase